VKPVSVNIELRTLRAAFKTAKRWKLIESNPFSDVELVATPDQAPHFLTVQDFERLLGCIAEGWLRELVLFAVLTGMRRGEILNLKWEQIDSSQRVVTVETSQTFRTKQGRRRTIPLNETALYLLNSTKEKSTSSYVFTLNDRPILGNWASALFRRYVREAKALTRWRNDELDLQKNTQAGQGDYRV